MWTPENFVLVLENLATLSTSVDVGLGTPNLLCRGQTFTILIGFM